MKSSEDKEVETQEQHLYREWSSQTSFSTVYFKTPDAGEGKTSRRRREKTKIPRTSDEGKEKNFAWESFKGFLSSCSKTHFWEDALEGFAPESFLAGPEMYSSQAVAISSPWGSCQLWSLVTHAKGESKATKMQWARSETQIQGKSFYEHGLCACTSVFVTS
jgi:hypothetical protein